MPKSKKPARKRGAKPAGNDTARRLNALSRVDRSNRTSIRGSVSPKGGRPPLFPGRTGGR